jgi:hypothetical protein
MDRACGTKGGEDKFIYGGKGIRKETARKTKTYVA